MKKIINFAIVGLGRAGNFHLRSINNLPNCNLKYVIDPHLLESAKGDGNHKFTLLKNLDEALLDPDLDAVIVSPPTQFHFKTICQSLEAGKHVFTEKPLGKSVAEIATCFDLAEQKELALYLGFQRRYDENFIALKQNISKLGHVRTVKISSRDNPKPSLEYLKISGNIFHDMLIHDFDMLQFLFGDQIPKTIFSFGHAYDAEIGAMGDYDNVLVTLKYPNGMMCSIDTSRTSAFGYDQRIEVFGDDGMAIAENKKNHTIQIHNEKGMHQSPINYSFPQRYKEAYQAEIADFVDGVSNNRLYNVTKKQCLIGHLIADAAGEAAQQNQPINFMEKMNSNLK